MTDHRRASTVDEFCERWRFTRDTFYEEVKRGLQTVKIGRKRLVLREDEEVWLAGKRANSNMGLGMGRPKEMENS